MTEHLYSLEWLTFVILKDFKADKILLSVNS